MTNHALVAMDFEMQPHRDLNQDEKQQSRPSSPKYLFLENTANNPPLNKRKDFRIPIQDAHAAREDWHVWYIHRREKTALGPAWSHSIACLVPLDRPRMS